jgi:hypothetical protein
MSQRGAHGSLSERSQKKGNSTHKHVNDSQKGRAFRLRVFQSLNYKWHRTDGLNQSICPPPMSWQHSIGIIKEHNLPLDQYISLTPMFTTHDQDPRISGVETDWPTKRGARRLCREFSLSTASADSTRRHLTEFLSHTWDGCGMFRASGPPSCYNS